MWLGGFIEGYVQDFDGIPIQSATIRVFRRYLEKYDTDVKVSSGGLGSTVGWIQERMGATDESGYFLLGPLLPGEKKVAVDWSVHTQVLNASSKSVVVEGKTTDLGVIRPEFPSTTIRVRCDGFERPDDLHLGFNARPHSEYLDLGSSGGVDLAEHDSVVIHNLPPGKVSITIRSWSNRTEFVNQTFEIDGTQENLFEIVLTEPGEESPVRQRLVISFDPPTERNENLGFAVIRPNSASPLIRYSMGMYPPSEQHGVFGAKGGVSYHVSEYGECAVWATNGKMTAVTRTILSKPDSDNHDIPVTLQFSEEAGAMLFDVRTPEGMPIPNARISWYWDDGHLEHMEHSPFLVGDTAKDGTVLLSGFPAGHERLVFRVGAPGRRSKVIRTTSGSALSSPRREIVNMEPG
ncbi:MAG: carboxypeptidase-like regulatory domain-containing protein [Planctomycetes bacterium]|nr:carboxypeptidase-like regulatory domain-containing protein [Planctomycetota bacterium]